MLKIMRTIETIPPTSVEAERAFSAAGLFSAYNKIANKVK